MRIQEDRHLETETSYNIKTSKGASTYDVRIEGGEGGRQKADKCGRGGGGGVGQLRTSIAEFPPLRNWPPSRGLWMRLLKFRSSEEIFIVLCFMLSCL